MRPRERRDGVRRFVLGAAVIAAAAGGFAACGEGDVGPASVNEGATPHAAIALRFVETGRTTLAGLAPARARAGTLFDCDGDGDLDVAEPTADGLRILRGDGKGGLASIAVVKAAQKRGDDVAALAGDLDGDGDVDLVLVASSGASAILRNDGGCSFGDPEPLAPAGSAAGGALADLDGDGDLDLVLAMLEVVDASGSAGGAGGAGAGGSGGSAGGAKGAAGAASGAAGADASAAPTGRIAILLNDGAGNLTDTPARVAADGLVPTGVAVGELDGQPGLEILATTATTLRLLTSDGAGAFRDAPPDALPSTTLPAGASAPALGDLDGDGHLDVVVPSPARTRVLFADGKGGLYERTSTALGAAPLAATRALVVDLDQDGRADVVLTNPSGLLTLLLNDGTGRLFDYTNALALALPTPSDSVGALAGDLDGDGDLDLYVARTNLVRPWLFLNWQGKDAPDDDGDQVPDEVDDCPHQADPAQQNQDASHFACAGGTDCAAQTGCTLAIYKGSRAYLVCEASPKSFAAARAYCQARGADLVVLGDAAENAFVAKLTKDAWIGLAQKDGAAPFLWVDGQTPEFTSWNTGEPNDSGGVEHCAMLLGGEDGGEWNDANCEKARSFVCEDAVSRTPGDPGDACDDCPTVLDPAQDGVDGGTCPTLPGPG